MYYDRFFPFYTAYGNPLLYEGEREQEQEFDLMKSYYPQLSRQIQERVEEECDRLDYEGSSIYDEYPDRFLLYHLCDKIRRDVEAEMEGQQVSGSSLDELVQVLLFMKFPEEGAADADAGDFTENLQKKLYVQGEINPI